MIWIPPKLPVRLSAVADVDRNYRWDEIWAVYRILNRGWASRSAAQKKKKKP